MADEPVRCFALYVADVAGPVDDGVCATCAAVFRDLEDAIALARERLADGYSVSIEIGAMTEAEWDALEEVPDDFAFASPASTDAVDPSAPDPGTPTPRENAS